MDISACAKSYEALINIEYEFVVAKKGMRIPLRIIFQKTHFYHRAGLHYLVDIQCLRGDREVIFDRLLNNEITDTEIQKSRFYQKIKRRIEKLAGLEDFFDSNETVFRYNPNTNVFSLIHAEYLLENHSEKTKLFAFIDKNPDGNYFCRSFFPQKSMIIPSDRRNGRYFLKRRNSNQQVKKSFCIHAHRI